jgi:hypothetical protein
MSNIQILLFYLLYYGRFMHVAWCTQIRSFFISISLSIISLSPNFTLNINLITLLLHSLCFVACLKPRWPEPILGILLDYLHFQYFDIERTWWRLFRTRVVPHTKLDIYVFFWVFFHQARSKSKYWRIRYLWTEQPKGLTLI